jgi:hypothetical protein
VPAVIAGLVAGSGLIVAFGVAFYPPNNNVLFDAMPYTVYRQHGNEILQIIENNATIVEHYKDNYLSVFHITERFEAGENCPFGSCARVLADSESGYLHIYVNYEKGFVSTCFEQRFNDIYNCAGERLSLMR